MEHNDKKLLICLFYFYSITKMIRKKEDFYQ